MSPSLTQSRPVYKIASIPADGIGPEVIEAGVTVLKKLSSTLQTFELVFTNFDWSSDTYKKTGKYMPDDALDTLRKFDAILFGAVGAPGRIECLRIAATFTDCTQMSRIIYLCGNCDLQSASLSNSLQMFVRPKYSGVPNLHFETVKTANLTG